MSRPLLPLSGHADELSNLHNLFTPDSWPGRTVGTHTHLMLRGKSRRWGAGAVCALMLSATTACTDDRTDALADCKQIEDRAFPAIEAVAETAMTGVSFTAQRLSYCEERGSPGAVVITQLPDYKRRSAVTDLLQDQGWTRQDAGLISPNGEHRAMVTGVTGGREDVARYIEVRFAANQKA